MRRAYMLHGTCPAGASVVDIAPEVLRVPSRVVEVLVQFPGGAASDLRVYPVLSSAEAVRTVGADQWANGTVLLLDGDHYVAGDDDVAPIRIDVPAAAGQYVAVRVENVSLGTLAYAVAIMVED